MLSVQIFENLVEKLTIEQNEIVTLLKSSDDEQKKMYKLKIKNINTIITA